MYWHALSRKEWRKREIFIGLFRNGLGGHCGDVNRAFAGQVLAPEPLSLHPGRSLRDLLDCLEPLSFP
jgi:hypothetical protein